MADITLQALLENKINHSIATAIILSKLSTRFDTDFEDEANFNTMGSVSLTHLSDVEFERFVETACHVAYIYHKPDIENIIDELSDLENPTIKNLMDLLEENVTGTVCIMFDLDQENSNGLLQLTVPKSWSFNGDCD